MRNILLNLSLLALVAAPVAAHATSLDQITFTGSTYTYSFIVPTTFVPTPSEIIYVPSTTTFLAFTLPGVDVTTQNGTFSDSVQFGTSVSPGMADITSPRTYISFTPGTSLFTGDTSGITFTLGSGTATADYNINGIPAGDTYSYNIASYTPPAAPAPEPSSLILLGTGALGLVGSLRRRLFV